MMTSETSLQAVLQQLQDHLHAGLIPFWLQRAIDTTYGGFLTNYDGDGHHVGTQQKYLNTQSRLLWWFSTLARRYPDEIIYREIAAKGFSFLFSSFWDERHDGWYWKVRQDGSCLDAGKIVYGQSFAIYALSEHYLATGDRRALDYASRTFNLLQIHCSDTLNGGYFENLEEDWRLSEAGFGGGDRKSLDTHMHLMESFATLYTASHDDLHRRKLLELIDLIARYMIDPATGSGRNQFDLRFNPVPAIAIKRTWNAERQGDSPAVPTDTTSFGHNIELAWLMSDALVAAQIDVAGYQDVIYRLVDHAVKYGIDDIYGGVYRDGTASGAVLVDEKEWWQQAESLVGLLEAYRLFKEERFWAAFTCVWHFVQSKMINHEVGEWNALLSRDGKPLVTDLGNEWKAAYHTGRSTLECISRMSELLSLRDSQRS
jgi:mannobiose 2-epimerase